MQLRQTSPASHHDGGDDASACGASLGADNLSLDLDCTGACAASQAHHLRRLSRRPEEPSLRRRGTATFSSTSSSETTSRSSSSTSPLATTAWTTTTPSARRATFSTRTSPRDLQVSALERVPSRSGPSLEAPRLDRPKGKLLRLRDRRCGIDHRPRDLRHLQLLLPPPTAPPPAPSRTAPSPSNTASRKSPYLPLLAPPLASRPLGVLSRAHERRGHRGRRPRRICPPPSASSSKACATCSSSTGAHFPREKTCGSGLSPSAIELADVLGVGEELHRRAVALTSVKIVTAPLGARDGHQRPRNAAAVVLLRSEFDDLLHRRALALGTKFEGGVRASELIREGARVVGVRLSDGTERRARVVLCADGAHSIFSVDRRPKRTISTLMGWWEGVDFVPGQAEMIFDQNSHAALRLALSRDRGPGEHRHLHGGPARRTALAARPSRNVREVFARFLKDHATSRA